MNSHPRFDLPTTAMELGLSLDIFVVPIFGCDSFIYFIFFLIRYLNPLGRQQQDTTSLVSGTLHSSFGKQAPAACDDMCQTALQLLVETMKPRQAGADVAKRQPVWLGMGPTVDDVGEKVVVGAQLRSAKPMHKISQFSV